MADQHDPTFDADARTREPVEFRAIDGDLTDIRLCPSPAHTLLDLWLDTWIALCATPASDSETRLVLSRELTALEAMGA